MQAFYRFLFLVFLQQTDESLVGFAFADDIFCVQVDPIGLGIGNPEILQGTFKLSVHKVIAEEGNQGKVKIGVVLPVFKGCLLVWFIIIGLQEFFELGNILSRDAFPVVREIPAFYEDPVFRELDDIIFAEGNHFISEAGNALEETLVAQFDQCFPDGRLAYFKFINQGFFGDYIS